MRYFILFFCLLFGQISPIQANYSAPQTVNYQVIVADIANPIEPIQQKKPSFFYRKYKQKRTNFSDFFEGIGWLLLGLAILVAIVGLCVAFPIGWFHSILWLWITGIALHIALIITGLAIALPAAISYSMLTKEQKKESCPGCTATELGISINIGIVFIFLSFAINAIGCLVLGILLNIYWIWIVSICVLVFIIVFSVLAV